MHVLVIAFRVEPDIQMLKFLKHLLYKTLSQGENERLDFVACHVKK